MKYYIHVDATYTLVETDVYSVEADTPEEAYQKWKNQEDLIFEEVYNEDYIDKLSEEFKFIEDNKGKMFDEKGHIIKI